MWYENKVTQKLEIKYPIIQAGKFFEKDGRKIMPLSITVHHAIADGYHVGLFLEKFQEYMNLPEKWMK